MDPELKKKLSNEKRLQAIQQWKQKQNPQNGFKTIQRNLVPPSKDNSKGKLKLFDSDGDEDNCEDVFKVRPQFEGQSGQHLLEMSSQLSGRFKLDERFKEDEKTFEIPEENEEKNKNIKILESILGYEVNEKFPDRKNSMNKKNMRFDPDDENAFKYLKAGGIPTEGRHQKIEKKKIEKSEKKEAVVSKEEISTSSERYIEVSSNLKDILSSSSSPFTLTSKFNTNADVKDVDMVEDFKSPFSTTKKDFPSHEKKQYIAENQYDVSHRTRNIFEPREIFTFFVTGNDARLKEGVEFFQRPKSLEEIREDWNKIKEEVVDLFRRKRKSNQRGFVKRFNTTQKNRTFVKK